MDKRAFKQSIELTNDGRLSLFFIGTGSAFSKTFLQTNLILVKGDQHLLVDCGSLCPYTMDLRFNSKIRNIKNLLVTHPHADHIGGMEELAFISYYVNKSKVNLIITDQFKKKLWNESLRGGMQFSETGKMTFDDYFVQIKPKLMTKKPFQIWELDFGGINLKLFRTHHVTTHKDSFRNSQFSVGLIIDDRILFTADSQFRPEQLEWIFSNYNIETIYHDCDISGTSDGVHATYEQLKTLPENIKSKMFLTHYTNNAIRMDAVADGFAGFTEPGVYYDYN